MLNAARLQELDVKGVVNFGGLAVAVGIRVAPYPPHRSVRALISAYGSCLGYMAAKRCSADRTPINPGDTRSPLCVGRV